jgi:secernin
MNCFLHCNRHSEPLNSPLRLALYQRQSKDVQGAACIQPNDKMDSCDTFVANTPANTWIFGKVSDRPDREPQNLVFVPQRHTETDEMLKCTYISIPEVPVTNACIVSQPFWLWGAENGLNEHGVVIGNEAVFTKLTNSRESTPGLIGMDLVRLGLERGKTARAAVDIIIQLLEQYGQNGNCKYDEKFEYDNSFLICDASSGFVVETAGRFWAVECVKTGTFRHITNKLSIQKPDFMSSGLLDFVREKGWCDGDFNWMTVMQDVSLPDLSARKRAVDRESLGQSIIAPPQTAHDMMNILRTHGSSPSHCGFCQHGGPGLSASMAAQVSVLSTKDSKHYFTATSRPCQSVFKQYIFGEALPAQHLTLNELLPSPQDHSEYTTKHAKSLFWRHQIASRYSDILEKLEKLENQWLVNPVSFAEAVEEEFKLYSEKS